MANPIDDVTTCPECKEGLTLDPSTGKVVACEMCNGIGLLTPGTICFCGRSCGDLHKDIPFCGDPACLKGLQEAERIANLRSNYSRPIMPDMSRFNRGVTPLEGSTDIDLLGFVPTGYMH